MFFTIPAWCGGCEPPKGRPFPRWLVLDQSCHMFRIEKQAHGFWVLERLNSDYSVRSREAVDCSKAVYEDGSYFYWPKSFNGRIWCPAYANPEIARKLALRKQGIVPEGE